MRLWPAVTVLWVLIVSLCSLAHTQTFVGYEPLRKSVVFLYAADAAGRVNTAAPLATGFLINIPSKSIPGRGYAALVTARHVVDPVWASCPPHRNPSRIFIRFNKAKFDPAVDEDGVEYVPVDLVADGPQKSIFTSPDLSVDAAVTGLPLSLSQENFEFDSISSDLFATTEETKQLGTGIEIVSAGMLPAFPGVHRNYPIFKFGHISAKPDERTRISCAPSEPPMLLRVWFIAANLVAGNSGSPIFSMPRMFTGDRAVLIGLQSISFDGSDVAGITPVQYIYEILESMRKPDWDLRQGNPQQH
jgi:hypothetical protein